MAQKLVKKVQEVNRKAGVLLALGLVSASAFATTPPPAFVGIDEAAIQSVYTGVLNQFGTWVGVIVGILAVIVGTMWIIRRMGGGTGVR